MSVKERERERVGITGICVLYLECGTVRLQLLWLCKDRSSGGSITSLGLHSVL